LIFLASTSVRFATVQHCHIVQRRRSFQLLRVTLNRLPGTFRRHVSTGRHQTRPERAGSASELKPSETNATIAGVLCRRSLLVSTPPPTRLPFLLEENGNGRFTVLHSHRTFPSTWNNENLEPGITRSVTPVDKDTEQVNAAPKITIEPQLQGCATVAHRFCPSHLSITRPRIDRSDAYNQPDSKGIRRVLLPN